MALKTRIWPVCSALRGMYIFSREVWAWTDEKMATDSRIVVTFEYSQYFDFESDSLEILRSRDYLEQVLFLKQRWNGKAL